MASVASVVMIGCGRDAAPPPQSRSTESGASVPTDVAVSQQLPSRFRTIGRVATTQEIRAWDIDANAEGVGLPPGRGTYARGATLFAERCVACHGAHGEGIPPYPKLIGREPRDSFPFGRDAKYAKTIGNYWPYATTVFDYINRAMPLTAPGSQRADDVYSLVAFLLAENEVIGRDAVVDAASLPKIHMPARDRFVRDDRTGGAVFR
ncbi:MAG TPA: cytochrome c [Gemmatimonadaceae bacterium]|nr:cytochrome c [Gemmatimonadaceae bacterium]